MDDRFAWILGGGLAMSAIALVGSVTLFLSEATMRRLVLPLVALAAGSLLGGSLFHLLPAAIDELGNGLAVYLSFAVGFSLFLVLEQFIRWHHCHRSLSEHTEPLNYLLLVADGLHNFIGGLAVAGAFVIDVRVGIGAWLAAAAHEIPQELGDFGVLVHGGWGPRKALLYNLLSGLTFLVGGVVAWLLARQLDVALLLPFAAGNFVYIAASDLIPEVNRHERWQINLLHFAAFATGLGLLLAIRLLASG
ncbi:ZIP family metal transporter [Vulgatibacter sp.]|uniref:ZIP family metal transporter n=1 Tax=Vulgatibacter sp. TaxID=1971226 RepID=UPI003565251F